MPPFLKPPKLAALFAGAAVLLAWAAPVSAADAEDSRGLAQNSRGLALEFSLDKEQYVLGETVLAEVRLINRSGKDLEISHPNAVVRFYDESSTRLFTSNRLRQAGNAMTSLSAGDTITVYYEFCANPQGMFSYMSGAACLDRGEQLIQAVYSSDLRGEDTARIEEPAPGVEVRAYNALMAAQSLDPLMETPKRKRVIIDLEKALDAGRHRLTPMLLRELLYQYSLVGYEANVLATADRIVAEFPQDARVVRPALIRVCNLLNAEGAQVYLRRVAQTQTYAGSYAKRLLANTRLWRS